MAVGIDDVFADVAAEYERLDAVLAGLSATEWATASGAPGWAIADVVLHLALTEEAVIETIAAPRDGWTKRAGPLDEVLDEEVRDARVSGPEAFARWRAACERSIPAMRDADPARLVQWAAAPLKPRTLATTRLAEHWAHGLDVTGPLRRPWPDTDRLRHVAWLGHATLPYAMELAGLERVAVRCVLRAPSGATWTFGPADAPATISGDAGAFCRVGARRVSAEESGLVTDGPGAADALRVLRNYAA